MKERFLAALLALSIAPAFADTYYSVTTQTVDNVSSEITWYFEKIGYTTARGRTQFGLKLVQVDGLILETAPKLPTTAQIGTTALSVFEYGDDVFYGQSQIETINIPDTIKKIGDRAFESCWSLRTVSLGKAVTEIGDEVFYDCDSLETVTLNSGLRTIGRHPFVNTAVTEISLPDTVLSIDGNIAAGTLYDAQIVVSDSSHFAYAEDGCLYNKDMTRLYACPTVAEGEITLAETTTEIGADAFFGCFRLTNIVVGASVETIGAGAFNVSGIWEPLSAPESTPKLTRVTYAGLPPATAATDIYDGAPTELVNAVTEENYAAWTASGTTWRGRTIVKISDGSSSFGHAIKTDGTWYYRVIDGCAELWCTNAAGENVTALVDPLTAGALTLPETIDDYPVTSVAPAALSNLRWLTSVTIPETYVTIGDFAFTNCTALTEVTLPDGLLALGQAPFAGTRLKSLTLPYTLQTLGGNPLTGCRYCSSIQVDAESLDFAAEDGLLYSYDKTRLLACVPTKAAAEIPETVTAIADDAFASCALLASLTFAGDEPTAADGIFADTPATLVSRADAYATNWGDPTRTQWKNREFVNTATPAPEGLQELTDESGKVWTYEVIGRGAVVGRAKNAVTPASGEVEVPAELDGWPVVAIESNAFVGCSELTVLTLPASVTNVEVGAFNGCTALTAFKVDSENKTYSAQGGFLYANAGKTLVKVPALYAFDATITLCETGTTSEVREYPSYFDDKQNLVPATVERTIGETFVGSTSILTFSPETAFAVLLDGVEEILPEAFHDCGKMLEGQSVTGTLVTKTDGVVISTETGTFALPYGTDSTNRAEVVKGSVKFDSASVEGGYTRLVRLYTETNLTTTITTQVPAPTIPSSVACPKSAWNGSVWSASICAAQTLPALGSCATTSEIQAALAGATDATRLMANIETAADYESFRLWASEVKTADGETAGQNAVMNNADAWPAYALDAKALPASALTADAVSISDATSNASDGSLTMTLAVSGLAIGANATEANLKKTLVVKGAGSLAAQDFSSDNVELTFETPTNGRVRVRARPTKTGGSFFFKAGLRTK